MKTEIIFWLNPKTCVITNRVYRSALFYEVGDVNQFGHVVLGIGIIKNKKLVLVDKGKSILDIYIQGNIETKKEKLINLLIEKLEKIKKGKQR